MLIEPEFVSDVIEMYQAGASQKEIVEVLNISYCQCRYWLKKNGLYDPKRRQHNISFARSKANDNKRNRSESQMIQNLLNQGFAYVSGYKNRASECVIRHTACGRSFERVPLYFKGECPLCKQDEIDTKRQLKRMKSDEWKRKTEEQREAKQKQAELKEYHRLYDAHICVWCNKIFTIKEYEEREGKRNVYTLSHCSIECKEQHKKFLLKRNRNHGHHRKRARKHGVEYIPGITLEKLVNRDGLTCALCGGLCDWNDKRYGDCGPLYPSIDHITPISKGGAHTWDNVQVAHFECNSAKRDRLDYICGA